jgi:hypothetical protein
MHVSGTERSLGKVLFNNCVSDRGTVVDEVTCAEFWYNDDGRGNLKSLQKICLIFCLSTTNPTLTFLGFNSSLRVDRLANKPLRNK